MALALAFAGSAIAGGKANRPALHGPLWLELGPAQNLLSDGRDSFAQTTTSSGNGLLVSDANGRAKRLRPPKYCSPSAMGGGSLVFSCKAVDPAANPPRTELYNIATARWSVLRASSQIIADCTTPSGDVSCTVVAIGSWWIEYDAQTCQDGEHCVDADLFQRLSDGVVENDPAAPGSATYPDLDSRALSHRLCSPLRVPVALNPVRPEPGSVDTFGNFVAAQGADQDNRPYLALQKCGTRHQEILGRGFSITPVTGTRRAIVWSVSGRPGALLLPSLKRFAVPLPPKITRVTDIALGQRFVYILANGYLWLAHIANLTSGR